VEEFHDNVIAKLKEQVPFIWGLDSLDAIAPEDEIDNDIRYGSFGASKPKLMSQLLRKITNKTKNTNSAIFIISQTRDNIGVMFGDKKTRSGGKALKFFCTHEMWLAVIEHIKKKELNAGVYVRVKVSKNKITGKERIVEFPIYYDYGIDDITSCIDFLMKEGRWGAPKKEKEDKKQPVRKALAKKEEPKKKKNDRGVIDNKKEITSQPMPFEELRLLIAKNPDLKEKLVVAVTDEWRKREASIATDLPPKYAR
jgi:hypothetical protein